jgi:hypothetical protein
MHEGRCARFVQGIQRWQMHLPADVAIHVVVMKPDASCRARLASHDQQKRTCRHSIRMLSNLRVLTYSASHMPRRPALIVACCSTDCNVSKRVRYLDQDRCVLTFSRSAAALLLLERRHDTRRLLLSESSCSRARTACVVSVMTRRDFKREPSQAVFSELCTQV